MTDLVSAGGTLLHVLLEGNVLGDGLTGILVLDLRGKITGVVLSSHGPSELGGSVPVDLLASHGGGEGRLGGRGKGSGRSDECGKDNKLVLKRKRQGKIQ